MHRLHSQAVAGEKDDQAYRNNKPITIAPHLLPDVFNARVIGDNLESVAAGYVQLCVRQ